MAPSNRRAIGGVSRKKRTAKKRTTKKATTRRRSVPDEGYVIISKMGSSPTVVSDCKRGETIAELFSRVDVSNNPAFKDARGVQITNLMDAARRSEDRGGRAIDAFEGLRVNGAAPAGGLDHQLTPGATQQEGDVITFTPRIEGGRG